MSSPKHPLLHWLTDANIQLEDIRLHVRRLATAMENGELDPHQALNIADQVRRCCCGIEFCMAGLAVSVTDRMSRGEDVNPPKS